MPVFIKQSTVTDGVGTEHTVWVALCPARLYDTVVTGASREEAIAKLGERLGEMPDAEGVVAAIGNFLIAEA